MVAFRADASLEIGTGHIMRCLTLAMELIEQGHQAFFICRDLQGNLINYLRSKNIPVYVIEKDINEDVDFSLEHSKWLEGNWIRDSEKTIQIINTQIGLVDWMIVDHYALDAFWEKQIKTIIPKVLVLDDLADRNHLCSILLDQNYSLTKEEKYRCLVPTDCFLLMGPKYALLREEFIREKKQQNLIQHESPTVLLFFGGSDPTNETKKYLTFLKEIFITCSIHVVVGENNPNKEDIINLCKESKEIYYHEQINYMAKLMAISDLAICAGGSVTWERYFFNLPAILVSVSYNQEVLCSEVAKLGIDKYLGRTKNVDFRLFKKAFFDLLKKNIKNDINMVDGYGKQRVIKMMMRVI